jgi:hypothetical protein
MSNIDLRRIREAATRRNEDGKLKPITRADLAIAMSSVLGRVVHETQIARYEEDGSAVPFDLLMAWLRCLGTTLDEQLEQADGSKHGWHGLDAGLPYTKLHNRLTLLGEYLHGDQSSVAQAGQEFQIALTDQLRRLRRKPNVALLGAFDAGKSTLVNWLLGEDSLPTRYQPATAVVTFVRHMKDKPEGLAEHVVLLDHTFDATEWDSLTHINEHKLIAGGLGTLRKYGLNEADTDTLRGKPAFALVFADSPILHSCNLIDNPGLSNDEEDTGKAYNAFRYMDVLLYASTATGFMNGVDIAVLKDCFQHLPIYDTAGSGLVPLAPLYIVATHAAPHMHEQLNDICESAAKRLFRELKDFHLPARQQRTGQSIDQSQIRQRIFTFWKESPECYQSLSDDLAKLLGEQLPNVLWTNADHAIAGLKKHADETLTRRINQFEQALADMGAARDLYQQKLASLGEVEQQSAKNRSQLHTLVAQYRAESIQAFDEAHHKLMQAESLTDLIKARYPSDDNEMKRDAQQNIGSHIVDQLNDVITRACAERMEKLGPVLEEHINFYEKLGDVDKGLIEIPFDAKGAFAGGIASIGTVSALGLAAAVAGNLGGYILIAHGVGILSSLGLGMSASGVMAAVSAIGGPVTLAIGIAAAAAFFGKKIFGEDWQMRLAKQAIKQLSDQGMQTRLRNNINAIWDDVLAGYQNAAENMHRQYVANLQDMSKQLAKGPEKKQEIEQLVETYKKAKDFFVRMPWF